MLSKRRPYILCQGEGYCRDNDTRYTKPSRTKKLAGTRLSRCGAGLAGFLGSYRVGIHNQSDCRRTTACSDRTTLLLLSGLTPHHRSLVHRLMQVTASVKSHVCMQLYYVSLWIETGEKCPVLMSLNALSKLPNCPLRRTIDISSPHFRHHNQVAMEINPKLAHSSKGGPYVKIIYLH